jgi:hypothetical protein
MYTTKFCIHNCVSLIAYGVSFGSQNKALQFPWIALKTVETDVAVISRVFKYCFVEFWTLRG